jgi:hypothetical protein
MSILETLENALLEKLAPILGPIKGLVSIFTKFRESTFGTFEAGNKLFEEVLSEYEKIRTFKERPMWRNRVVSVPRVIDNFQKLVAIPEQVFAAFKDLTAQLKGKIKPGTFDVEELEGLEDLRGVFSRLGPKITAGFEKVLGIFAIILDALVTTRATIDDLKKIVDAVKTVREDLENLDGVFLPQNNSRKTIQSDIGPIRIRVGKLHGSQLDS